ncbi:MAG TPA: ankyrin repeat domain-containing protein [Rhodocyclaceae bacterium]|jgi:SagB-type dehydrogenase family enzyme
MASSSLDIVLDYHRRTKHRLDGYAAGPEALDWDSQPAPFRTFAGADKVRLPLLTESDALPDGRSQALSLDSLGALFQFSLGLTAWKSMGPDRWAVRANPSSGNLHPVEAYALIRGVAGLADGLWHYCPDDHSLECRAACELPELAPHVAVILTSIPWREAWKYGERAFRYCQLDVGHAQAALAYAAALLGWSAKETPLASATLAQLAGTDRSEDFIGGRKGRPDTEREEAELLLSLNQAGETIPFDSAAWRQALKDAHWSGAASSIDRHPLYQWPVIDQVFAATRDSQNPTPDLLPWLPKPADILQRRSAQRYDVRHVLPLRDFVALLSATSPAGLSNTHLLLFVHRVEGLDPGVYLLPRSEAGHGLYVALSKAPETVLDIPGLGPLLKLVGADPKKLQATARQLQCHQDLAATGSFSLGMITGFDEALAISPARYRNLYREAGVIGQALYLKAEALGVRGCGIGCYFDDAVHQLLGLQDTTFQSLYHFAVGLPIIDPRIETLPPYAHRQEESAMTATQNQAQAPADETVPYHCIPAAEAAAMVLDSRAGKLAGLILLDSRDAQSYTQGHVEGAMNLSGANQDRLLMKLNKDAPVVIYCYHGNASRTYAGIFSDFRFKNVYSVDGGYAHLVAALHDAETAPLAPGNLSPALLDFLKEWDFDPADLNAPRKNSLTPLMRAALLGNAPMVAELLTLGADIGYINDDGNNALWLACVSGNGVVVQRLLDAGIEKNNRNALGSTTLMYCASSGKADMLKILLDNGADPLIENFDDARAAELCSTPDCLRLLRASAR